MHRVKFQALSVWTPGFGPRHRWGTGVGGVAAEALPEGDSFETEDGLRRALAGGRVLEELGRDSERCHHHGLGIEAEQDDPERA
jgi:hypothetical protein